MINKHQLSVKKYLLSLLDQQNLTHPSSPLANSTTKIEEYIFQRLTSKKFRKTKLDEACAVRTKLAIQTKLDVQQPLKIIYPQGGYKLWRFPSAPRADWAEFFNIAYLIEYLLPVVTHYSPGVELVYYMHTLLMELHDNLTTKEIREYVDSFQELIDEFRHYLPKNFKITILKDADLYSRNEYFAKLEEGKKLAEVAYQSWPDHKKQDFLRMAKLNIKWHGKEDWTVLSDQEKQAKMNQAALYEIAATQNLKKVFELVKSPDNILVFTKASPDFIGIGSTRSSMAKHWVGFGVLETNSKGKLQPRILTPRQYQLIQTLAYKLVSVNLVSGENFRKIMVFDHLLQF